MNDERDALAAAWSAPDEQEAARVRAAADAVRRTRRAWIVLSGVWLAAALVQAFAPDGSRLHASARALALASIALWLVVGFVDARRRALAGQPGAADLDGLARTLRDERRRELRWWIGPWAWGGWIAGLALATALLASPARTHPRGGHVAVLLLLGVGGLLVASSRYLRELRLETELARLDALVGRDAPPAASASRRGSWVRAPLRVAEIAVALAALALGILGPDPVVVNARELMHAVDGNARWSNRLGLTHGGTAPTVEGDPIDRYCKLRARLAPTLAFVEATAVAHVGGAIADDLAAAPGTSSRHDASWQRHALAWEDARRTLLTSADRALRAQGLRPDDLRAIGARVEAHDGSAAFRLDRGAARAHVALRVRALALESVLADPSRAALHAAARPLLDEARAGLDRSSRAAGAAPADPAAPCGAQPVAGIDWLTVLDVDPSPWNEAVRWPERAPP